LYDFHDEIQSCGRSLAETGFVVYCGFIQPAEGFVGFNGMHRLALYPIWFGHVQKKLSKGRFSCMITTTCLIGLGIVPDVVVTDVSVPVFVYRVVRVPVMLVIVSVGVLELVKLVVDVVVAMLVVIDVVELAV